VQRLSIYGQLFRQVGVQGSNFIVTGKTSFQADYSDKFTLVSHSAIDGKIIRPDPLYGYDELGSLINLTLDHIVIFPIVALIVNVFVRYKIIIIIIPNRENIWFKI
jgi:hypothetical protein